MKQLLICLLVLVAAPLVASAQTGRDCGSGLPCGPIPWQRITLPRLPSPTPMATLNVDVNYQPTANPTTPPTGTPGLEVGELNDGVATLQSVLAATPFPINNSLGTPVSPSEAIDEVSGDAANFFGFARSVLSPGTFGILWPLVAFSFTALMIVLLVKSSTFLIPAIVATFGLIRKIVDIILGFIPG